MAQENVKKFFEELTKNKELQEKINASNQKHKGEELTQEQRNLICEKELLPIAKEYGFEFTMSEFNDFNNEIAKTNGEIKDEELEQVAGGQLKGGCGCFLAGGGGAPSDPGQQFPDFCVCAIAGFGGADNEPDCECMGIGAGFLD